jgi:uncharacterized membrane protein YhaH (DUF805 family)
MTFTESIKRCLIEKYADFNGRASKSEYWWFALFSVLVYLGVALLSGGVFDETGNMSGLATTMFLLVAFALLLPSVAVAVRRLHDTDKSGWFYLVALIPYVGGIILLVLLVLPAKEPNRFGETVAS